MTVNRVHILEDLYKAIIECNERGLIISNKWAAEQFYSFSKGDENGELTNLSLVSNGVVDPMFLYAQSLFDAKEYLRASNLLKDRKDEKSLFLRYYCKLLYIQSLDAFQDESSLCVPKNNKTQSEYEDIILGLEEHYRKDSFLLYLYGVTCLELKMKEKAKEVLKLSLLSNPLNWSCWLALGEFCDKPSMLLELASSFPPSLGLECWKVHELNNLHASPESVLPILDKLAEHTPKNQFLGIQRAILYHNARDFDEAELLFENLQKSDPYLIDAMDLYSNVLYVRRNFAKLCDLAHTMSMTDRFRSETCICIGNYYSMRGDRKKAIESFSRALQLDHNCSAAWTLLGHEYVDSCNPKAAVEVYRKAIDINPRDYRAWYGLGQAYDLLQLPSYSIYYHQRAIAIRPNDGRMWGALASSLEATGKLHEAIKCLKRVMLSQDASEPAEFGKCAQLYAKLHYESPNSKYESSAAFYYKKYLFEHSSSELSSGEYVDEANAFLIEYHQERDEFSEAAKYSTI